MNSYNQKLFYWNLLQAWKILEATVTMKKISHLLAFSFYPLTLSFHSTILLAMQSIIQTISTMYITVTSDLVYNGVKTDYFNNYNFKMTKK